MAQRGGQKSIFPEPVGGVSNKSTAELIPDSDD